MDWYSDDRDTLKVFLISTGAAMPTPERGLMIAISRDDEMLLSIGTAHKVASGMMCDPGENGHAYSIAVIAGNPQEAIDFAVNKLMETYPDDFVADPLFRLKDGRV